MKKRLVTREDVAAMAGVSTAVVSYVINNGPRPVSPVTRTRVEKAIEELGYFPNELARGLRLKQSSTIGLIIPNLNNQVYAEIAISMGSVCRGERYLVLLCNSARDPKQELEVVQMLRAKHVDGVVAIPSQDPLTLVQPLENSRIPVVVLEHDLPGHYCIVIDDLNGGHIGTEHLLSLGHRRIAMINRDRHSGTSALRLTGYRESLRAAGIEPDSDLVVECPAGCKAAYQAMQQMLKLDNPPTAVFTHNDIQALGAMHAIQDAGLSIPDDVSVVGFDDTTSSAYFSPPLTTVRLPKTEMGELAARTILHLARHEENPPPETVVLPVELIIRPSTAPLH